MPIRYKRADLEGNVRALAKANSEFRGMIADEMQAITPQIEESMLAYSRMSKNRVTGRMEDAMQAEVSRTGLQLRFGFIRRVLDYFQYQTVTGFTHWQTGRFIEPSLALSDAKEEAEVLMKQAAVRVRRRFMARIRRG